MLSQREVVSIQFKFKKGKICLITSGHPSENVIQSFSYSAVFTEHLDCAEHLLSLVDEDGKLGKSLLLVGLIWIFYTSGWIFYT